MRAALTVMSAAGALLLVTAGCGYPSGPEALAPERVPRVGGARVTVRFWEGTRQPVAGELITVSNDSLWVLAGRSLAGAPLAAVETIRIRRHGLTAGRTIVWGIIGGAATGGGLASACAQVGSDCGSVFAGTFVSWLLVSSLAALGNDASSNQSLYRPTATTLLPYARFPQGWPPGLARGTLGASK